MNKRLVMLLIIDGFGISNKKIGNAIYNADTSNLDYIKNKYPSSVLNSSGKYVGLEDNLNGNSNVGHYTIGSGRIVLSDFCDYSAAEHVVFVVEDYGLPAGNGALRLIKYYFNTLSLI